MEETSWWQECRLGRGVLKGRGQSLQRCKQIIKWNIWWQAKSHQKSLDTENYNYKIFASFAHAQKNSKCPIFINGTKNPGRKHKKQQENVAKFTVFRQGRIVLRTLAVKNTN